MISRQGIEMAEDKVKAFHIAQTLDSLGAIHLFLGYENFYSRFIQQSIGIEIPLYELKHKNVKFV